MALEHLCEIRIALEGGSVRPFAQLISELVKLFTIIIVNRINLGFIVAI